KESASAEVFEQEWRLVLHCTSIQQHLSDLFSGGFVVTIKSNSSLQCIAIAPTLGIDVGTGVQQHLDNIFGIANANEATSSSSSSSLQGIAIVPPLGIDISTSVQQHLDNTFSSASEVVHTSHTRSISTSSSSSLQRATK